MPVKHRSAIPLHIAVGKGDVTVKNTLKFGGDPNIRNKLGKVPLHIVWSCWLTAHFSIRMSKNWKQRRIEFYYNTELIQLFLYCIT